MWYYDSAVTGIIVEVSLLSFVAAMSYYMNPKYSDKSAPIKTVLSIGNNAQVIDMPSDAQEPEISTQKNRHSQAPSLNETSPGSQTGDNGGKLIVSILERYRMSNGEAEYKSLGVMSKFLSQIERYIARDEPVCMVLPAFPFKSANKTTKVLGTLPDKGEEVALRHLNGLCQAVEEVYKYGARVYIVSDGLVYNDILGVSDQEVWRYGQALRQMAKDCMCHHVRFARLRDLLGHGEIAEPTSEEFYVEHATHVRAEIMRRFLPRDFDPTDAIAKNPDMNYTYCGYAKFMATELAGAIQDMPVNVKRRHCKDIAKSMIVRGKAFADAIACAFPDHLRLSIHPSTETTKLSVAVVPQKGRYQMTPWHSAVVRAVDGSITMCHAQTVSTTTHELIFENGRPSYFRERSDLFDWPGMNVEFEHLYPSGIKITLRDPLSKDLVPIACVQKLFDLAKICSPIVLRNFGNGAADGCGIEAKCSDSAIGYTIDIKA